MFKKRLFFELFLLLKYYIDEIYFIIRTINFDDAFISGNFKKNKFLKN